MVCPKVGRNRRKKKMVLSQKWKIKTKKDAKRKYPKCVPFAKARSMKRRSKTFCC